METSSAIQCESSLSPSHSTIYYYCFKCKEILCNECLIIHLCMMTHERNSLKKIEEAIIDGKVMFTSIGEILQNLSSKPPLMTNGNPINKLVNQKEIEAIKLFDVIQAQNLNIQDNLNRLFGLVKNMNVSEKSTDYKKDVDQILVELNQIASSWESTDMNTKIQHLKTISLYENKAKEIVTQIEKKESKNQNKNLKEKAAKDFMLIIEEIGLNSFGNWYKKQADVLNQTIKSCIIKFQKTNDESSSDNEEEDLKIVFPNLIDVDIRVSPKKELFTKSIPMKQEGSFKAHNHILQDKPDSINSTNTIGQSIFEYKGSYLFGLRRKDNANPVEVFCYSNKKISINQLSPMNFYQCFSPLFPFRNSKSINLGQSLMITGGCIDMTITNKTFLMEFDEMKQIKITSFKSMLFNRESHNVLFIQKINTVIVCNGQLNNTAERIDLSSQDNDWKELPSLNNQRANATMLLLNDNMVYCIGGYNNQENSYVKGYECLNLDNISIGWNNIIVKENLAISTMGIIQLGKATALLIGGFEGGKKYLQDGLIFDIEGQNEQVKIEKRDNVLNKGIIFYSSPQFFQIGDEMVNFDFKLNLVVFDPITKKARVV